MSDIARPTSSLDAWSTPGERLPAAEAAERFDLRRRLHYYDAPYYDRQQARFRVVDGDLHIAGNLILDWEDFGSYGLLVSGNLTVDGSIVNANMNGGPLLLVGGTTCAHAIVGGGAQLVFEGDVRVDEIVIGHYNDGILLFRGNLAAPAVVNMDHYLDIRGELDGRWFDILNDDDRWSDFLDKDAPGRDMLEDDEWRWLDKVLFPLLAKRGRVLRDDLPPKQAHPLP